MLNANEIWCLLISHGKLERDRGTEKLQEICKSFDTNDLQCFKISDKSCSASLNCKNEEILADISTIPATQMCLCKIVLCKIEPETKGRFALQKRQKKDLADNRTSEYFT